MIGWRSDEESLTSLLLLELPALRSVVCKSPAKASLYQNEVSDSWMCAQWASLYNPRVMVGLLSGGFNGLLLELQCISMRYLVLHI